MMFALLALLALPPARPARPARPAKPAPACSPLTEKQLAENTTLTESCYSINTVANVKGAITVEPGVHIVFGPSSSLYLENGGSLTAVGTEDKPIVFEGKNHTPGYWNGLTFSSNSSRNQLSYVKVADGGTVGSSGGAVVVSVAARLSMDHTTIRNAEGNGLYVAQRGILAHFEKNHFHGTEIPLSVKASDLAMLDPDTTFADNKKNYVQVYFNECNVSDDQTWRALKIPYHFDCSPTIESHVSIAPGATLEFTEGTSLDVRQQGSLSAVGTQENPIVFTGTDPTPGYWRGVFIESNSARNVIRNAKITYAGQDKNIGGGVCISVRARASVSASEIAYNLVAGIHVLQNGMLNDDAASSNKFHDNKQDILKQN